TIGLIYFYFFFSSRRRHTRSKRDWSSDVCSSDLPLWNRRILWIRCLAAHSPYLLRDSRISSTPLWKTPWEIPATMRRSKIFMSRSEERRVGKESRSRGTRWH